MKAEAFEACEHHARLLVGSKGQPYPETAARLRRIDSEYEETKNPLLLWGYPFGRVGWVALDRIAQIRLLRVAARYRATGEVLKVNDPFGDVILHARTDGRMRFWSLGHGSEYFGGNPAGSFSLEVPE